MKIASGVGRRMGLSFAVLTALIIVAAGGGGWTIQQQASKHEYIDGIQQIRDFVAESYYDVQDLATWMSTSLGDTNAYGYKAAIEGDRNYNYQQVLAGKERVYSEIAAMKTDNMLPAERAEFDKLKPAWDAYFKSYDGIKSLLRQDTRAALARAQDNMNNGANAGAWQALMDINGKLDSMVKPRMESTRIDVALERQRSLIVIGLALAAALVLAVVLSVRATRSVVRPLAAVVKALGGLAKGDLTVRVDLPGNDELSQVGRALDETTDSLRQTVGALAAHAAAMSSASNQVADTAAQIAATAQQTSTQADLVTTSANRVSGNVRTVAAGSDEIGNSIGEISQNVNDAAQVAAEAVDVAEATNATVARLGASSLQIGNFVDVITSIAEQTNLLALNATIEAARAGEAGKGFAVVASEVKDLAQETAKATDDIARRISAIQADTTDAVTAIDQITAIIGRISDYQNTIATSVEEQTATTAEMGRNVAAAADGSADIASHITSVADAATVTANAAGQSLAAATELARIGAELRSTVAGFRIGPPVAEPGSNCTCQTHAITV